MKQVVTLADSDHEFGLARRDGGYRMAFTDDSLSIALEPLGEDRYRLACAENTFLVALVCDGDRVFIHMDGESYEATWYDPVAYYADESASPAAHAAIAPMPGTVVSIPVTRGDRVAAGDVLAVIESMKLETALKASRDGVVIGIHAAVGQTFERDAVLVSLSPVEGARHAAD